MRKIGIILLLILPLLVAWFGLHSYFATEWYYSTAVIDRNDASIDDMNRAFAEVSPKSPDLTFQQFVNTNEMFAVGARDVKAQPAADKASAIATALVQKLQDRKPQPPRILDQAQPAAKPITFPIVPNMLAGAVLGLIPAIVGLILIIVGSRNRTAAIPAATQSA